MPGVMQRQGSVRTTGQRLYIGLLGHGAWVWSGSVLRGSFQKINVPREPERSCTAFYDPTSEVLYITHAYWLNTHNALVESVISLPGLRGEDIGSPLDGKTVKDL